MAFNKNKVMDAARKFHEKGQTDKAIKEYLKVVNHDPKDVRVWLKIGDLYAKKGAKQDATETYMKVAKFYGEQGFYLKAVAVYKQILKLDPRMVEVNLKLAELYRQLGLLSDAMQHFERVAAFFHREGKTKEALATIRQLVDLDPDNVATRIKLAELYSKEEMTEEAIKEFRHACDYLRSHNRQDDFIKVAERLLWHDNSDIGLNRELSTLYLRRNDPRRALQKLQTCFKADPRDVETLALLAQAFQALDQKSKTVSVLKELARVFTENGQTSQAMDVHRKILMFAPDDPDSREALGEPPSNRAPAAVPPRAAIVPEAVRTPPPNPTGSMPIVTTPGPAGSGASNVVEYTGDDDFVADISVDDESFHIGADAVEANADEIVKILTETDVYVKYGLQQKAIDHLQRVFELDPGNIEARERLKDIYVSADRTDDAVEELLVLAERVGAQDPERAEMYLSEAAGLDPHDDRPRQLARRLGVHVTTPEVEIVDDGSGGIEVSADDFGTGSVEPVSADDLEFDDIEFGDMDDGALNAPTYLPSDELSADFEVSADDFEVGVEAIDEPGTIRADPSDFEFELDDYDLGSAPGPAPGEGTQEVAVEQVAEELSIEDSMVEELSFEDVVEGTTELAVDDIVMLEDSHVGEPVEELSFDAPVGFDDQAAIETAEGVYADDFGAGGYDDPYDDAESLDAAPIEGDMEFPTESPRASSSSGAYGADVMYPPGGGYADPPEHLPASELRPDTFAPETLPPDALGLGESETDVGAEPIVDETVATSLEDDLDEADFFVTQNLFDEARDILNGLLERYPNHPLILAKLQDITAMESGSSPDAEAELEPEPVPAARIDNELATRDLTADAAAVASHKQPQVKLEQSLDDEDADTHFDLGLAYKEMGLYDEAIKAFTKVSTVSARAVECHMMIGLCYREQGALAEAVQQFKAGLYVDGITDREKLGLYYEIGVAYEQMDDPGEALYFLEMVIKKDAKYRDISERVTRLRAAAGTGNGARKKKARPGGGDDLDAAFDQVVDGTDASRR